MELQFIAFIVSVNVMLTRTAMSVSFYKDQVMTKSNTKTPRQDKTLGGRPRPGQDKLRSQVTKAKRRCHFPGVTFTVRRPVSQKI